MIVGFLFAIVLRLALTVVVVSGCVYAAFRFTVFIPWLVARWGIHIRGTVHDATRVNDVSITLPKGPVQSVSASSIQLGCPVSLGLVLRTFLGGTAPVPLTIQGVRVVLTLPIADADAGSVEGAESKGIPHALRWLLPLLLRLVSRTASMFKLKVAGMCLEVQGPEHRLKVTLSELSVRCSAPSGFKSKAGVELLDLQAMVYQGASTRSTTAESGSDGAAHAAAGAGAGGEGDMQLLGSCAQIGCSAVFHLHRLSVLDAKVSVAPLRVAVTQDAVLWLVQQQASKRQAGAVQAPPAPATAPDLSLLFAHTPEKASVRIGSVAVRLHPGSKLPEASMQLDAALQQLELNLTRGQRRRIAGGRVEPPITVNASWGPILCSVQPVRPHSPSFKQQQFLPFAAASGAEGAADSHAAGTGATDASHSQMHHRPAAERRAAELKLGVSKLQATLSCTTRTITAAQAVAANSSSPCKAIPAGELEEAITARSRLSSWMSSHIDFSATRRLVTERLTGGASHDHAEPTSQGPGVRDNTPDMNGSVTSRLASVARPDSPLPVKTSSPASGAQQEARATPRVASQPGSATAQALAGELRGDSAHEPSLLDKSRPSELLSTPNMSSMDLSGWVNRSMDVQSPSMAGGAAGVAGATGRLVSMTGGGGGSSSNSSRSTKHFDLQLDAGLDVHSITASLYMPMLTQVLEMAAESVPTLCALVPGWGVLPSPASKEPTPKGPGASFTSTPSDSQLDLDASATMQLPNRAFRLTHEMEEFEMEVEPRPFTPAASISLPATPVVQPVPGLSGSAGAVAAPAPAGPVIFLRFGVRTTLLDSVQVLLSNEPGSSAFQLHLGRLDAGVNGTAGGRLKTAQPGGVAETDEDIVVTAKLADVALHVWHTRPPFGIPLKPSAASPSVVSPVLLLSNLSSTITMPIIPPIPANAHRNPLAPDPPLPISVSFELSAITVALSHQALTTTMDGLFPFTSCACTCINQIQQHLGPANHFPRITDSYTARRMSLPLWETTLLAGRSSQPAAVLSEFRIAVSSGIDISYAAQVEYSGPYVTEAAGVKSMAVTLVQVGPTTVAVQPMSESAKAEVQSLDVVLRETVLQAPSKDGASATHAPTDTASLIRGLSIPNGADTRESLLLGADVYGWGRTDSAFLDAPSEAAAGKPQDTAAGARTPPPLRTHATRASLQASPLGGSASQAGSPVAASASFTTAGPAASAAAGSTAAAATASTAVPAAAPGSEVRVLSISEVQLLAGPSQGGSEALHVLQLHSKRVSANAEVDTALCWIRVAEGVAALVHNCKQRLADLRAMLEAASGGGLILHRPRHAHLSTTAALQPVRENSLPISEPPLVEVVAFVDALDARANIGVHDSIQVALRGVQAHSASLLLDVESVRVAQNKRTVVTANDLVLTLLDPDLPPAPSASQAPSCTPTPVQTPTLGVTPPGALPFGDISVPTSPSSPTAAAAAAAAADTPTHHSWTQRHRLPPRAAFKNADIERHILLRRIGARERLGLLGWAPERPSMLCLKIKASQVVARVPHETEPGRLIFYTELWVEAILKVVQPYVDAIKQALDLHGGDHSSKQRQDFVELVFDIDKVAFGLDAHPLEHWFALHGPAMAAIAGRRQLTERMLEHNYTESLRAGGRCSSPSAVDGPVPVAPGDMAQRSGGSFGRSVDNGSDSLLEDEVEEYCTASDPAWHSAMEELFGLYRDKCSAIRAACASDFYHRGALMHVAADDAHAVIMICNDQVQRVQQVAHAALLRVDPASSGITFSKLDPISIDASVTNLMAHFSGAEPSTARIARLHAHGCLVRARQLAARPTTFEQTFPVGAHHAAPLERPVRGSRPPAKAYTDFIVSMDQFYGVGTMGLMSSFAQLGPGFKRLIPPDFIEPDGSPSSMERDTNAWWDMMRYMWRGSLMVRIRDMNAALGKVTSPVVTDSDERMVMQATTFHVGISAGRIEVVTTDITAAALATNPVLGLGEPMLHIPYINLPLLNFVISGTWQMPGGRHWLQHHIFPVWQHPPPPDVVQAPLDTAALIEGLGWNMTMDIGISPDSSNTPRQTGPSPSSPAPGFQLPANMAPLFWAGSSCMRTSPVPRVYIGEFQWVFLMDFVDCLSNAPVWIERAGGIRNFFARRKGAGPPAHRETPLPQLQRRIDVNFTASIIDFHHDAQDPEDPSDNTYMRARSLRYKNAFTYSHTTTMVKLSNGSKTRVQQSKNMVALSVELFDLKVVKGSDELGGDAHAFREAESALKASADAAAAAAAAAAAGLPETLPGPHKFDNPEPAFENGLILSVACLLLRQEPPPSPTHPSRKADSGDGPIRIVVQDVRILCPKELRDTVLALSLHIHSALSVEVALLKPQRVDTSMFETLGETARAGDVPLGSPREGTRPTSPNVLRTTASQSPGRSSPTVASKGRAESVMALTRARGRADSAYQHALALKEQAVRDEAQRQEDELLQAIIQQNRAKDSARSNGAAGTAGASRLAHSASQSDMSSAQDTGSESGADTLVLDGGEDSFENMDILLQTLKPELPESQFASTQALAAGSKGILEYEIEFVHIQVNLVCPDAGGSLLLGANSALLKGHRFPELNERTLTFTMDQVQAHMCSPAPAAAASSSGQAGPTLATISPTHPDYPGAPTPTPTLPGGYSWLRIVKGNLQPDTTASAALQKHVLRPFRVQLCQSEAIHHPTQQDRSPPSSPSHQKRAAAGKDKATRELTLTVPEIDAVLDSVEFDCLMDIIQNLAMAPVPKVDLLTDYDVPFEEGVDNQAAVKHLAAQLAVLKMRKRCLQQERLALANGDQQPAGMQAARTRWQHMAMPEEDWSTIRRVASDPTSTRSILTRCAQIQNMLHSSAGSLGDTDTGTTMMAWITGQVQLYHVHVEELVEQWKSMRQEMAKLLLRPKVSSRMLVTVNTIQWQLTRNGAAFVEALLKDISFNSTCEQDYSGNTKVQLRSILLRDLQGTLGPAPGMDKGVILMPWKPDATWEDDEMMRMFVINGPVDNGRIVYEHLEVLVHPVMVHMTMALGMALSDYFTPSSSPTSAQQPSALDPGSGPTTRASTPPPLQQPRGASYSGPVTPKRPSPGGPTWWGGGRNVRQSSSQEEEAAVPSDLIRAVPATYNEDGSLTFPQPAPSIMSSTSRASTETTFTRYGLALRQKRAQFQHQLLLPAAGQLTRTLPPSTGNLAALALADPSGTPLALAPVPLPRLPDTDTTLQHGRSNSSTSGSDPRSGNGKKKVSRRYKFKHVRFNNFFSRVTIEGQLLGTTIHLTDWTLVLDTGVFRNLEVSWGELLDKYRRDVLVSSLLKSVSGLQTKKINILKDHPDSEEHMLKKAAAGLKGKIKKINNLWKQDKKKKEGAAAALAAGDGSISGNLTSYGSDNDIMPPPSASVTSLNPRDWRLLGPPDPDALVREHVKAKKLQHLLGNVPPLPGSTTSVRG